MKRKIWRKFSLGNLIVAGFSSLAFSTAYAETVAYEQVVENKVYIVGSIADKREVVSTMESLELAGMTGAFVVSPEELRNYPNSVKAITSRGHKLIVQMSKNNAGAKPVPQVAVGNRLNEQGTNSDIPNTNMTTAAPVGKEKTASQETRQSLARRLAGESVSAGLPGVNKGSVVNSAGSVLRRTTTAAVGNNQAAPASTNSKSNKVEVTGFVDPASKAMKAMGNKIEEKPLSASSTNTNGSRKAVVARDFLGKDENNKRISVHYPATAKDAKEVPDWVLESLGRLNNDKLFAPDDINNVLSEPDRVMLAKFIVRAKLNNKNKKPPHYERNEQDLKKLAEEFDTELSNLGSRAENYAKHQEAGYDKQTKIRGEIRHHYVDNDGQPNYDSYDMRTRLRLYVEQPVAKDWSINAMGEADKSWPHDEPHGNVKLERLYAAGKIVDTSIRAGRFGELYAEGNVYDGRMDGVSVETGKKVMLHAAAGRLRDEEKGGAITARYADKKFDTELGVYSFSNVKSIGSDTIVSAGGNYYMGNFSVGGMILGSSGEGLDGGQVGIVGSLRYGRNRSWVPGTYEIFAKYYNQPEGTYVGHTMVGLADRMHGFKGVGLGFYYTLAPNLLYGFEYYDLKERLSNRTGRTIWNHISYYF